MKGVSRTHQIDLLEKYQVVTKEDVLAALQKHFLPLFDPTSSVAVVVTAPAKSEEIGEWLKAGGFEVTQKVMDIDPSEMEEDETDTESDSSDNSR
jgi:Zn-dependent M16 (insulinase) family peptidase